MTNCENNRPPLPSVRTLRFLTNVCSAVLFALPILGPSNIRDTVGRVGDLFLDPLTYALWDEEEIRLGLIGGALLVKREELLEPLDDLRASSVDYYAATRGAYYQNRALQLAKGRAQAGNPSLDRLFDELE